MKKLINYTKKIVRFGICMLFSFVLINLYIVSFFQFKQQTDIPKKQIGLVLGAYVYSNGNLSDILKDRVYTAIELYEDGKIEKLILSGDHGQNEYDEVNSMKEYVL